MNSSQSPAVYLDHNATTPIDDGVLEAMMPFFQMQFGNAASRTHRFGQEAAIAVEQARAEVASLINADPKEIIWTSGCKRRVNSAAPGGRIVQRGIRSELIRVGGLLQAFRVSAACRYQRPASPRY